MRGERLKTPLAAALLFSVNAYIVHELFAARFIAQIGSIEGVYIGLVRYILAHWGDLSWFSPWYGGIPFHSAYPPVLPFSAAALAALTGASPALAYHAVAALFYCLGPVTLFWMAYRLSGSRLYSFVAALAYSLFSPGTLVAGAIRADAGGVFHPRRLQALIHYGEAPHIASMTLVPLAIVALDAALRKPRPARCLLAALAMAAVVLTNWIGGLALAAGIVCYLLTHSYPLRWKPPAVAAGIGLYAYLLASPWIPPSTLATIRRNAAGPAGPYPLAWWNLAGLAILVGVLAVIDIQAKRLRVPSFARFGILFSLAMGTLVVSAYWLGFSLVPQPERYHLELEMGLILAAVFAAGPLLGRRALVPALWGLAVFGGFQIFTYRVAAQEMTRPIDIQTTTEYRVARWFEANIPNRRVYAPGSIGQWLLAFTDTPQLSGGFDQGVTNSSIRGVDYQIYSGQNAGAREDEIGELLLRAYGVEAVYVGDDVYHAFRNRRKFSGRFRELWRDGGDAIYAVPHRPGSLAHVVPLEDMVARDLRHGCDVAPLRAYVAALDNPALPAADFRWLDRHRATVTAEMSPRQVLSVQMTYDAGWHAAVRGEPRRIYRDHLGQLAVEAACNGPCQIELTYDGGLEMRFCRLLSLLALAGGLLWAGFSALLGRRRKSSTVRP